MDISASLKTENLIELPNNLLFDSPDGTLYLSSFQNGNGNINGQTSAAHSQTMVELGKQLLQAASLGDVDTMKLLMTSGAPFTGNWLGLTPLHAATRAGHMEAVQQLLKAGIFRDVKTKVDRTALQMAAEEGHTNIAEVLLSYGADVNAKDMLKMTALHWAVEREHVETVSLLLTKGACTKVANKFGKTVWDIAIETNNLVILELLQNADLQNSSRESTAEKEKAAQKLVEELSKETGGKNGNPASKCYAEYALDELAAHSSVGNPSEGAKLLESHGITLLPPDNSTVLNSAMESGQTLSLTEAGKLALKEIRTVNNGNAGMPRVISTSASPMKKIKLAPGTTPRIVRMTTSQLLALAGKTLHLPGNNKPIVITLPKNIKLAAGAVKTPAGAPAANKNQIPKPTATSLPQVPKIIRVSVAAATATASTVSTTAAASPLRVVPATTTSLSVPVTLAGVQSVTNTQQPAPLPVSTPDNPPPDIIIDTRTSTLTTKMTTRPAILGGKRKSSPTPPVGTETSPQGSARTLPITDYCKTKRTWMKSSKPVPGPSMPTIELFPEESANNGVMLSIMEETGDFTNSSAGDDDDILDPLRLAAQLAAIRKAASHFSVHNS